MRLTLDTNAPLIDLLPALQLDQIRTLGRKHVAKRQHFLIWLLTASYERRWPHVDSSEADSFSRNYLVQGLRVAPQKDRYKKLLQPFYQFVEDGNGYNRDRGVTKSYRLRPQVREALQTVYESNDPVPVVWRTSEGAETVIADVPPSGLPADFTDPWLMPSVVKIPTSRIDGALDRVTDWIDESSATTPLDPAKPNGLTLGCAKQILSACRKWVMSLGGLPNLYDLQSHGRLGPSGFHLIPFPSRIRHLLFEDSGLMDYDIASCFWSIFRSLGRSLGFPTASVDDYINHKEDWHAHWRELTRCGIAMKKVALSWLTGGTRSAFLRTQNAKLLGIDAMRRLQDDARTTDLYREIQNGMKRVIKEVLVPETDGKDRCHVNAVGATLQAEGTSRDFGRLCAHALTGFEQFAIREMCRQATGIQAVIYDGFIAPPQPAEPLEEHVKRRSAEELGITLDLQLQQADLSARQPEPELLEDF
jgi:hypothetical protein